MIENNYYKRKAVKSRELSQRIKKKKGRKPSGAIHNFSATTKPERPENKQNLRRITEKLHSTDQVNS